MKEKIKKLLKDRKKLIGVIGVALLIIVTAIICAFIMSKKQDKNVLKLKQDQFIVEYGDSISLDPRVYLKEDINNDIISNTEVEILGDKKYEAGKEYFAVGDYQIQLTYEDEKIQTQVTVKDTTIPILNIPATIEIPKNTDLSKYDFKSLITASDLSQLTDLKFDTSKVDMTKKGEYQATVSVEDSSKNKAEKTFTIKVVAELKENEKEDNNSSITANGGSTSKPTCNNNSLNNTSNNTSSTNKPSNSGSSSKPSGGISSTNKPSNSGSSSKPSGGISSTDKPLNSGSSSKPSGGTSSTNKPSSNGGNSSSSNNKPSTNTDNPSSEETTSKPSDSDEKEEKPHTHIFTSNTGKWFNTQAECVTYYEREVTKWENKLDSGEITWEEFGKKCPMGYEVYRCTCGKRTLNLSYAS